MQQNTKQSVLIAEPTRAKPTIKKQQYAVQSITFWGILIWYTVIDANANGSVQRK